MKPKTTLDQWLTLIEISKAGSIQAAANNMNKSHTTLIYAIKKLEGLLNTTLIRIENRKAVLTEDAKVLLRRATPIVEQTKELELIGTQLCKGTESEITVTIDHLCKRDWLYNPLKEFLSLNTGVSVKVLETSLSSTKEAVKEKLSDIAIINIPITNHLAEIFGDVSMVAVISEEHVLAKKTVVYAEDLLTTCQIVVRDLGGDDITKEMNVGWLRSQQRLTVDNFEHALSAVKEGIGFCRVPTHVFNRVDTKDKKLVKLPLYGGACFQVPLHLTLPKMGQTGPAATHLYELLLNDAKNRISSSKI